MKEACEGCRNTFLSPQNNSKVVGEVLYLCIHANQKRRVITILTIHLLPFSEVQRIKLMPWCPQVTKMNSGYTSNWQQAQIQPDD